jgi:hypothetical protein
MGMLGTLPRWVAASLIVYVCAANLWVFVRRDRGALPGFWRVLMPLAQLAFMVGPPYAALLSGLVSPAGAFDVPAWTRVLDTGAPLVVGAGAVISVALWLHRRFLVGRYPPDIFPAVRMRTQLSRPWGFSFVLFDAFCRQAHWAFYRLGAAVYLRDVPLGAAAGCGLILAEWWFDPGWRARLWQPGLAEDQVLLVALMLISGALSVLVPGFWLLPAAHLVLWLLWYGLLQRWYGSAARSRRPAVSTLVSGEGRFDNDQE